MFSTTRFPQLLGSIAAVSLLFALAACGGGSSSHTNFQVSGPAITTQPVGPEIASGQTATLTVVASGSGSLSYQWYQGPSGTTTNAISGATASSYTTPTLKATTSYWVQVTDANGSANSNTAVVLIAGPRQVQALLSGNFSGAPYFNSFLSNVLPNISGVSVALQWSQIESTNAQGDGSGGYDFTSFDTSLQPFVQAGRTVNLIVWPATEGGNNDPNSGGSTPAYVLSSGYATSLNTTPQDMTVCPNYTGDSSNPYYAETQSGSGGIWNVLTNEDLSGLPVSYELPFMTAYKAFIQQVISHYNQAGTTINGVTVPTIGYIRFGFSQGGENSPECNQFWPNFSQTTYVTDYVGPMTQLVAQQSPKMTILEDMHALGNLSNESASVYIAYADQEAQIAATNGLGIGTNGLQASDITQFAANQPCDSDWCNMFAQYASVPYKITLSLQTLQWTDPTGAAQTGSLTVLEPFAKKQGANNLELYLADVGLAFDSANYSMYPHASATISAASYSSAYVAAIQDFLAP
ncbi:MAG: hypothetical protein WAM04_04515 [Candidatus Sulfotelmatobacter sp.]